MSSVVRWAFSLQTSALLFALATVSLAEENASATADLATAYNQAMAQFQAGNYAKAATDLEALAARMAATPQVEPIYYTIGSAWFNAGEYGKAIAAFKIYQAKFPSGAHAAAVAFAIARSNLLNRNFREAAAQMAALECNPQLREQALISEAEAFETAGKFDDAIRTLERLVGGEMRESEAIEGAMTLARLYADKGDAAKAVRTLGAIHRHSDLIDNLVRFNSLMIQLGDGFYSKGQYAEALACYRNVYTREQVAVRQRERIAAMQGRIAANVAAARANPAEIVQLAPINKQLNERSATAQKQLEQFLKLPSITPAIYLRLGRCFYELDRKWEAVVAYEEILDRFAGTPEREPALFGVIVTLAEINQPQRAEKRCAEYLRDFKNGPNAATVAYLQGAVALQAGDPKSAEASFQRLLATDPKSQFREPIRYLLGNARFAEGSYDAAVAAYKEYLAQFPKGPNSEDVRYRIALAPLFAGKYQSAMDQLREYLRKHPESQFVPDARYRLAVCKYAASLYEEVIADCQQWEQQYPNNAQSGEVLALLGDAYAATDRVSPAIAIYIRSYQAATTDEVMNYSLFAASKLLQQQGDWPKVAELFRNFIAERPDSPGVVAAVYWIGKAKVHERKIEEAKQIAAETIRKYIDDPEREAVEQLITQLAQLCAREKPAGSGTNPAAQLERLLGGTANETSATGKARICFAKAELARLHRDPAEEKKNIARMASDFKPEDLSPPLLGKAGDYLLETGKPEQAEMFYRHLLDDFPKSSAVDYAYNGLGEIAYRRHEYRTALRDFSDGLEKSAGGQKLKEISLGQAKTLLAVGKLDEAQKAFELVASVREWRGEATACSVYSLGEIAARRGKWAEANAYFQRVYVGYQKFLPWVAKAYVASGQSFEKLGKTQEAMNTYREMLRNPKLASFAETGEARKRLQDLGEGS